MTFDAVVGQQTLTQTLKNAITNGKLAHAYLFCGPRGVGKTTCARIFARAINCMSPTADGEACGECESCRSFAEQRSFNIFELDAASNNSVDDIKQLMDQTRIPPQVGKYKVFIIDEVHMLSTQAFNAFLKTLEEPPAHVIFILATTEKHKLLPTIISRCQIYDFERMTVQNTIDYLKMVADKEGYTYEEEALAVIAEKADGGMRDALSIFDQTASYCQGNITYERVIEDLNVLDADNYFRIVDLSLENNTTEIMLLLNDVISKGFDGGNLCQGLASHIRNVMMAKDPKTTQLLEVSERQRTRYAEQAVKCQAKFLCTALKILTQCDLNYKQSSNKRLLVELTLIQVSQITQPDDDAPASGRCPNRLKSLFKHIVRQTRPVNAAPQVAAAGPTAIPAAPETADGGAIEGAAEAPAPKRVSPKIKLSGLGFTFSEAKQKENERSEEDGNEAAEETRQESTAAVFTQEELAMEWLRMCNRMQLAPEFKVLASRMKNIIPVLGEFPTVDVIVENSLLLNDVKAIERRIAVTLRNGLNNNDIKLNIRLAEPKEYRRLPSKAEMLEEMRKSNPALELLFKSFDLELS